MDLPKLPTVFTTQKDSPINKLNIEDIKRVGFNALLFVAPVMFVFFNQLATGTDIHESYKVALVALWILLADTFKKLRNL